MSSLQNGRGNHAVSDMLPRPRIFADGRTNAVTRREENKDIYMWPIGRHAARNPPVGPTLVSQMLGKEVCQVACGEVHYAAVTFHGELFMWGNNKHGQLGQFLAPGSTSRTPTSDSSPSLSAASSAASTSTASSASSSSDGASTESAAAKEEETLEFGPDSGCAQRVPQIVPFPGTRIHSVACGKSHTVCLTVGGAVFAWGKNKHGELGVGDTCCHPTPTLLNSIRRVSLVACGDHTSAAYADTGKLYMWGQNDTCQLGVGHNRAVTLPQLVARTAEHAQSQLTVRKNTLEGSAPKLVNLDLGAAAAPAAAAASPEQQQQQQVELEHVEVISLGQYHSTVLTTSGEIWQWGKLGDTIQETPVRVALGSGVRAMRLACGSAHVAAIGDDNVLYTWGDGHFGQLGRGVTDFCAAPLPVPAAAFGKHKPVQVSCAATYTAVVVDDGSICVFGLGSAGKSVLADEAKPQYLRAFKSKRAVQVCCGPRAMVALVTQRNTPDCRLAGWVPDREAPVCMGCKAAFTTLRRRHHCRKCEGVFCAACSGWKCPLLSKGFTAPVRVCFKCFTELSSQSKKAKGMTTTTTTSTTTTSAGSNGNGKQ